MLTIVGLALCAVAHAQEPSVSLLSGLTFPGRMVGCDAEGRLAVTAPFLHGTARVPLATVASLRFKRTKDEADAPFLVRLTNGDRVAGAVTELDDDGVTLDTPAFGEVAIPRKFIHSIDRRKDAAVFIENDFRLRGMEGWSILDGTWPRTPRGLLVRRGNRAARAVRKIPHTAPFTFVAHIAADKPHRADEPAGIIFRLLCNNPKIAFTTEDRLYVAFDRTMCRVEGFVADRGIKFSKSVNALTVDGTWIRVAFEPKTERLRVWAGEQMLIDMTLEHGFAKGSVMSVITTSTARLQCLGLYAGVVAPDNPTPLGRFAADRPTGRPGEAAYRIVLTNGDRVAADAVELAGAKLVIPSPDGEFKVAWEKVARIVAPVKGRESPPAHKDDVRLWLQHSIVTGRLGVCTEREINLTPTWGERLRIAPALAALLDGDPYNDNGAVAPPAAPPGTTIATLKAGARLSAAPRLPITLLGIAKGRATFRAAWVAGSAQLDLKAVARLTIPQAATLKMGGAELTLSDGSTICGTLTGIDAEAFRIEAEFGQQITIPRKHVRSARTGRAQGLVSAHDFRSGKLGPWRQAGESWQFTDQGLLVTSGAHRKTLSRLTLAMKQNEPVTVELTVRRVGSRRLTGNVTLFTQDFDGLTVSFYDSGCRWNAGGKRTVRLGTAPAIGPTGGTVTMAWNPGTKQLTVWGQQRLIGTVAIPDGPTEGSRIEMHETMVGHVYESVCVWRGIMPGGADRSWADDRLDVVRDKAGRFYRTEVLKLADGKLILVSDDQPEAIPWADVRMIITSKAGRAVLKPQPGHARVTVGRSRLLMSIDRLTDKHLEGRSPVLGSLRIPRAGVRGVEMP